MYPRTLRFALCVLPFAAIASAADPSAVDQAATQAVRARLTPAPSSGPQAELAIQGAVHAILHPGCGKAEAAEHQVRLEAEHQSMLAGRAPLAYMPREEFLATDVLHNSIDIELFAATRTITGTNTMTVRAVQDISTFSFALATSFTISSVTLNATTVLPVDNFGIWGRRVTFPSVIPAGTTFTLTIAYNGAPVTTGLGSFVWAKTNSPVEIYTLSQPYFASSWWPAKDGDVFEPGDNADKSTIELKITHPFNVSTVSNGLLQSVTNLANPLRKRTYWKTDYQIPPYLVCFATGQYRYWTLPYNYTRDDGSAATMPVQFAALATSDNAAFRANFETVVPMLGLFRDRFGLYPFINEKYGIYQFGFGGGQEHTTYTGQSNGQPWLNAHELAHQWWGDDVTCRTWHDIWLNEGMASYSEAMYYELALGAEWLPWYMANVHSVNPDDANSVYVYNTADLGWMFSGNTTYAKGAWVFHMLRHIVGDDTFWQILKSYRAMYTGSGATTDDFIAVAEAVSGRDLSSFFDFWVYKPGTLKLRTGSKEVIANGRGFLKVSHRQIQGDDIGTVAMPIDLAYSNTSPANISEVIQLTGARVQHSVAAAPLGARLLFAVADHHDWVLGEQFTEEYVQGPPVVLTTSLDEPGTTSIPAVPPILSALNVWFSDAVDVDYRKAFVFDAAGKRVKSDPEPDDSGMFMRLNFGRPLPAGTYTLKIPSNAVTLRSTADAPNGRTLDGEIVNNTLPSGDGVSGGDLALTFTIENPADFNRDGFVTFEDFDDFIAALESGDSRADLDANSALSFEDFDLFIQTMENPQG